MDIVVPEPEKVARYKMNTLSSVRFLKDKETPPDFREKYDLHSGDNSRVNGFHPSQYYYLQFRTPK
jgi:hypothetical protein